jgi:hypothetical protein
MNNRVRSLTGIMVAAFLCFALPAFGQIVGVANATGCSGTGPGGTICGGTGSTPLSVTGIENDSVILQAVIGTQTAPQYEVVNDTGSTLNTLTFTLNLESSGSFASNQKLDCQTNGGFAGDACTTTANGISYGESVQTPMYNGGAGFTFPVTFTFSGLNIASGGDFDITFASFGNSDTGLQTGGPVAMPEGSGVPMLAASGLVLLGTIVMKRRFIV